MICLLEVGSEGKRKYFINVDYIRFPVGNGYHEYFQPSMQASLPTGKSVEINCVQWFNTQEGEDCQHDIKEAEQFLEKASNALEFVNYED